MIKVICHDKEYEVEQNTRIIDFLKMTEFDPDITGAIYNGKIHDLNYNLKVDGELHYLHYNDDTSRQMLERSLSFLFISAMKQLFPEVEVRIAHSLSGGLFCKTSHTPHFTAYEADKIRSCMQTMIDEKEPIVRRVVSKDEAVAYFTEIGMPDKAQMLENRNNALSSIYTLKGVDDYFYGVMVIDCSYIRQFTLELLEDGFWLSYQPEYKTQPKLLKVFTEYENWGKNIGITNVNELNDRILHGDKDEVMLISEAMIEKKLSELANVIVNSQPRKKVILIAGPSSAGKTTFSKRLAVHLKIHGLRPITISMDDFYVERVNTPLLPDGSYDYENVEAVELSLFNETISKLLDNQEVVMPIYDFASGKRLWQDKPTKLEANDILIIEGIHGLNPRCSSLISDDKKFKIYINALTHLNYDNHSRIPTTDYRMIRRMVRDYQFRGRSPKVTIQEWKKVRDGEDRWIYPYQEEADYIFNTSMLYEMTVLKKMAIPLLDTITIDEPEYLEANRIRKLLEYFVDGDVDAVPNNSILAEFVGNSIFF